MFPRRLQLSLLREEGGSVMSAPPDGPECAVRLDAYTHPSFLFFLSLFSFFPLSFILAFPSSFPPSFPYFLSFFPFCCFRVCHLTFLSLSLPFLCYVSATFLTNVSLLSLYLSLSLPLSLFHTHIVSLCPSLLSLSASYFCLSSPAWGQDVSLAIRDWAAEIGAF